VHTIACADITYLERSSTQRDALLFPANNGKYLLSTLYAEEIWKPMIAAAVLVPAIRIYDPRHTFVAHLLEAGENPAYVKERAGTLRPRPPSIGPAT
jgi:site-specific recombinase XerD